MISSLLLDVTVEINSRNSLGDELLHLVDGGRVVVGQHLKGNLQRHSKMTSYFSSLSHSYDSKYDWECHMSMLPSLALLLRASDLVVELGVVQSKAAVHREHLERVLVVLKFYSFESMSSTFHLLSFSL